MAPYDLDLRCFLNRIYRSSARQGLIGSLYSVKFVGVAEHMDVSS